jgi:hypothetical protein
MYWLQSRSCPVSQSGGVILTDRHREFLNVSGTLNIAERLIMACPPAGDWEAPDTRDGQP